MNMSTEKSDYMLLFRGTTWDNRTPIIAPNSPPTPVTLSLTSPSTAMPGGYSFPLLVANGSDSRYSTSGTIAFSLSQPGNVYEPSWSPLIR